MIMVGVKGLRFSHLDDDGATAVAPPRTALVHWLVSTKAFHAIDAMPLDLPRSYLTLILSMNLCSSIGKREAERVKWGTDVLQRSEKSHNRHEILIILLHKFLS